MHETLTPTLPPAPTVPGAMHLIDFLPFCAEADEYFDLLLLAKLFFARTRLTTDQLASALAERRKTGLSLEHLIVRSGFCGMQEALEVVAQRRRVWSILQRELAAWPSETPDELDDA